MYTIPNAYSIFPLYIFIGTTRMHSIQSGLIIGSWCCRFFDHVDAIGAAAAFLFRFFFIYCRCRCCRVMFEFRFNHRHSDDLINVLVTEANLSVIPIFFSLLQRSVLYGAHCSVAHNLKISSSELVVHQFELFVIFILVFRFLIYFRCIVSGFSRLQLHF